MKIAILTQPLSYNYGGILQNYALQQVLQRLGHDPITFDQVDWVPTIRIKIKLRLLLLLEKYKIRQLNHDNAIDKFKSKYINTTYKADSLWDFKKLNWKYRPGAIIVGSDQVWRPRYNWGCIDKMFLSFVPKRAKVKRIAYAVSFGTSEWEFTEEEAKKCKKLLQRFDAVSTREIDGIELCSKYLNRKDVVNVLDPTLLLEKNDYLNLCKDIPKVVDDILFAYILDLDDKTTSIIENIAQENGMRLKLVSAHSNWTLSIEEWIAMFRDAKLIITDSFHGTVFSIIFNKNFYSICNQSRGNSRFTSLLTQFDLLDRLYSNIQELKLDKRKINWEKTNNTHCDLKNISIKFLTNNLRQNA